MKWEDIVIVSDIDGIYKVALYTLGGATSTQAIRRMFFVAEFGPLSLLALQGCLLAA